MLRVILRTAKLKDSNFHPHSPSRCHYSRRFFSTDSPQASSELPRVESLVSGCDYQHWLVVTHSPPHNYPQRDQIIHHYITTLSMALGSEEAAKKSIYSVSTKYYYAFSCKVPENLTHKIKSLPGVKWILPDSYLYPDEDGYGGEPLVDGEAVSYDEKYHSNWSHNECDIGPTDRSWSSKTKKKNGRRHN
ncbi:multiple organellar RNA editing factor 7, mitochondrial isoform X1 [Olea europaea var. sylvestris]|uniref:multiple organellar RNA editing factor 7, mitochondrial isoform X1 n=1 Tax=Olea europaea var. sylvestris TaxID=158386 RepID=UPI000C1D2700|nr:multiple organellar RNA editing factor 7, mitochondrial isoform X1 [Olea europaea var. sylvestris]